MSAPSAEPFQCTPLPIGWLVEGYRIRHLVARGGFSFVYQAVNRSGEVFALKEYFPHGFVKREDREIEPTVLPDKEQAFWYGMKCFFEEGRTLAQIRHPNVIRVCDLLRAHETVYLVMAFEEGRNLQHYFHAKRGRVSEPFLRALALRLLSALRAVHAHRLLHLDLKPANVILRHDGQPVILDFGAARHGIAHELAWQRPMYTPGYAPPELVAGQHEAIGPWSDLYALGAILFAGMTGKPPPKAEERQECDTVPEQLQALADRYSESLRTLTETLLARDPLARPQSAYAVYKRLRDEGTVTLSARISDAAKEHIAAPGVDQADAPAPTSMTERTAAHSPAAAHQPAL